MANQNHDTNIQHFLTIILYNMKFILYMFILSKYELD